jgi:hypothetical protein
MKQPEDNATLDMYGDEQSTPSKRVEKYVFYIRLDDDTEIEWRGLSHTQAKAMNVATHKHLPDNVVAYGWEVIP